MTTPILLAQAIASAAVMRARERVLTVDIPDARPDNPAEWIEARLLSPLYPKQREVAALVAAHDAVACCGANSSGKDFLAARLALWWVNAYPRAKVVITAPTYRQIQEVVWQEARTAYLRAYPALGGTLYDGPRLRYGEERFILGFSTDKPYQLQGLHSPNLLVIVSEAHGMNQAHIDALWRLNPSKMLLTGNPISDSGEFYDAFHSKANQWATATITAWDTPNFVDGEGTIPGLVQPSDEMRGAARWGKDSALYRVTYLSEWVEGMGSTVMVPLAWVYRAEHAQYAVEGTEIIGVDVARYGSDSTVIYARRGRVARKLYKANGLNTMEVTGIIAAYHAKHPRAQIVVDGTGLGAGVVDRLRELGIGVIDFVAGAAASDSKRYTNLITECWWRMREAFQAGIQIERDDDLRAEITTRKYRIQSDARIAMESKDDMRKAGKASPDSGDALAQTFYLDYEIEGEGRLGPDSDVTEVEDEYEQMADTVSGMGRMQRTEQRRERREDTDELSPYSASRWHKGGRGRGGR